MTVAASVFLVLAGLVHVYIFVLESVRWRHPATWRIFGLSSQADADTTAPLAYNQGFYNLFLAIGVILGVILFWAGARPSSRAQRPSSASCSSSSPCSPSGCGSGSPGAAAASRPPR
jgi:putative membrane protein